MEIEFIPVDADTQHTVPPPEPAKKSIPDWYKSTPRYINSNEPKFEDGRVSNNTVKACYPFYDALCSGYIQKTWCDIHIDFNEDGTIHYNYSSFPEIISYRGNSSISISNNFWPVELIWKIRWLPKLPKGWSALFVSPLNRIDLPFESLSAIIDSDEMYSIYNVGGDYPFFIKKGRNNFIIPEGTPMYQIIPIKRESWKSKAGQFDEIFAKKMMHKMKKNFIGSYKRNFRHKKEYL